jgi:hypothetical protein
MLISFKGALSKNEVEGSYLVIYSKKEKKYEGGYVVVLLIHSDNIYLPTVQPVLELFMRWLGIMSASQMKMQKCIVYLV